MFRKLICLFRSTARTRRGERPVKMRHPRSCTSADVMEGFRMVTHHNNTTTSFTSQNFSNANRHQNANQKCWTVEFRLSMVPRFLSNFWISPLRREVHPRAGSHRMRDHEGSVPLFNPHNRIVKGVLYERTSAGHRFGPGRHRRKPARADRTSSHPGYIGLHQIIALEGKCTE
jgi:hypothetical protein